MVKDFLRKLIALVALLFLLCLVFGFPVTVYFSNEIVETLLTNKAVWLIALVLVLGSTKKEETSKQNKAQNNQYEVKNFQKDDESLILP